MNYLGIDIGAVSAKAALINGRSNLVAHAVMDTGSNSAQSGEKITQLVLGSAHLAFKDIAGIVATGYGRSAVTFAERRVTEITCHARGAHHLFPEVRTVIDIGGLDSKGIRVDSEGRVVDFVMNDKCAAGTGRFLEVMARALALGIEEMGSLSLTSTHPCQISSVCTVFAESEVISLRAEGKAREDIIAGIHRSIASRIAAMMCQIGLQGFTVITGGVALNGGVVMALEDALNTTMHLPEHPQITGALGAALIALDDLNSLALSK